MAGPVAYQLRSKSNPGGRCVVIYSSSLNRPVSVYLDIPSVLSVCRPSIAG